MSAAERVYRLLLRAYPTGFRAVYGREMVLAFRDRRREAGVRGVRFWGEILWDVARSAPALRLDALWALWDRDIQTGEDTMKTMAMLAMLIGVLEAVNAVAEAWGAGVASGTGYWVAGVILTVAAGVLLFASGLAMLRRAAGAVAWARGAAIMCLAVVVLIRIVQPWMSILATLLGIGFPIALLIFLRWTRGTGLSEPTTA